MKRLRMILFAFVCVAVLFVNAFSIVGVCSELSDELPPERFGMDAKEPIDLDRECSLRVTYTIDGDAIVGKEIALHRISTVSADYDYQPIGVFKENGVIINGIQSQVEWEILGNKLFDITSHIGAEPVAVAVTDENGVALFSGLAAGVYFVPKYSFTEGDTVYNFKNVIAHAPTLDDNMMWNYNPILHPKYDKHVPSGEMITYSVRKVWSDEGDENRPRSVRVLITKDGEEYDAVTLSSDNEWRYSWEHEDDGSVFDVTEQDVPSGYEFSVLPSGTDYEFVIRNYKQTPPPQTGDASHIQLYIVLFFVSGIMLVLLGVYGKRRAVRAGY